MSAALLCRLIEAGTPAALVAEVAAALAQADAASLALRMRRQADAARQQKRRAEGKPKADADADADAESRDVTGHHVMSRDIPEDSVTSRDIAETPENVPPHPPKNISLREENPVPLKGDLPLFGSPEIDRVVSDWNAMAGRTGLKSIRTVTAERRGRILARLREHGPDSFTEAIAAIERSRFCRGQNDRRWRADFDFLLQPRSFVKLIEGSYEPANDRYAETDIANPMVRVAATRRARRSAEAGGGF
ncbi:hypothetical protein [Sphingomonas sp. MM-1]|uniref:hypothetical protein n=1 Tax=Sphingomonas sp. MM-1 TaxID=745310 RepID=UPI001182CE4C|nr:hypothetical protein [Sphingomonas sp. MM-1]